MPDRNTSRRRRSAVLLAVAALIAIGGGRFAALLLGDDRRAEVGETDPVRIVGPVFALCGTDEACIKENLAATANAAPAASVDAVHALFETSDAPAAGCHWALHLLGQTLKPRTRAGEDLGLDGHWHVCGYAVLHGAFEDVPLDGDVRRVGRDAFAICLNGVLEGPLVGQCFHPIGHTIELNLPGSVEYPYLLRAEAACIEGAWHARVLMATQAALKACVSGAHMRHRDSVVKPSGRDTVTDGEEPQNLLPQCAHSLVAYACITLYMEDAFAASADAAAADLLVWCAEKSPDATEVCGYFFGLAARGVPGRSTATAIEACTREAGLSSGTRLACLRGVLERSGDETPLDTPGNAFCQSVEELDLPCAGIREFMPAYPELVPLDTALAASGRSTDDLLPGN